MTKPEAIALFKDKAASYDLMSDQADPDASIDNETYYKLMADAFRLVAGIVERLE